MIHSLLHYKIQLSWLSPFIIFCHVNYKCCRKLSAHLSHVSHVNLQLMKITRAVSLRRWWWWCACSFLNKSLGLHAMRWMSICGRQSWPVSPPTWRYRKPWGHPKSDHSIQCHSLKAVSWKGWGDGTKPTSRRIGDRLGMPRWVTDFFNEFYVNIPTCVRSEEPPSLTPSTTVAISSHTRTTKRSRRRNSSRFATIECHKEQRLNAEWSWIVCKYYF